MSHRVKIWAKKARAHLMHVLGGRCMACGKTSNLTFDCIKPQGHKHHEFSSDQAMCFYRKQWRMGNLQILCAHCNSVKGDRLPPAYLLTDPNNRARVLTECEIPSSLSPYLPRV